jgi:hypothetical protein
MKLLFGQVSHSLIEVNSEVDTSVITIGDRITYSLTIDHIEGMRVENPGAGVNLGQFEIKDYTIHDPILKENRIIQKYDYVISVFDTGKYVIPPFPVAYFPTDSLQDYKIIEANSINIYVQSVVDDENRELKDIKSPIEIPYNYLLFIALIGSIIILIAMVFFAYKFYKNRKETGHLFRAPEPPRPAHEVALKAIDELLKQGFLENGQTKEFYIHISEIMRHYIEGRYFVHALEQTSSEILADIAAQELSLEHMQLLEDFFELSDFVKFAKYLPKTDENDKIIEAAKRFVLETMVVYEEGKIKASMDEVVV